MILACGAEMSPVRSASSVAGSFRNALTVAISRPASPRVRPRSTISAFLRGISGPPRHLLARRLRRLHRIPPVMPRPHTPDQHPLRRPRNLLRSPRHSKAAISVVSKRIERSEARRRITELPQRVNHRRVPFDVFSPHACSDTIYDIWLKATMSGKLAIGDYSYKTT